MVWSIQVARIAGIPVRLHLTFLFLIAWIGFSGFSAGEGASRLILALGLFACVLLHEFGHAFMARRFGVQVLDITLLPIGGLARMGSIPKEPRQEFWIALAGPLVNFVLAPLFHGLHLLTEPHLAGLQGLNRPGFLLEQLAVLNLVLGLFNLLPAFPMDGGRILRAALASRMSYARATQIAAQVGQLVAFGMAFAGLLAPQIWWVFIALFVFLGASEEGARVQTQTLIEGVQVRAATITEFHTLRRADSVGHVADLLLAGTQQDFPVVEEGQVIGLLTRRRLLEALAQAGRDPYVSEVMEPAPEPVSPDMPLQEALERMATAGETVVPVQSAEGLYGLLTTENATELVMVRSALLGRTDQSRIQNG